MVPHDPLSRVFEQPNLWLGVAIGLDAEMTPRQQFLSVPYAMSATKVNTAIHGVPAGTIVAFGGGTAPAGWLLCDGGSYSTTGAYESLFAALGHTWGGSGDTFRVPDFRGRALVGAGPGANTNTDSSSAQLVPRAAGTRVGEEKHTLTLPEIPPHNHTYFDQYAFNVRGTTLGAFNAADEDNWVDEERTSGSTGGNEGHNTVQPSASVHYIIKF